MKIKILCLSSFFVVIAGCNLTNESFDLSNIKIEDAVTISIPQLLQFMTLEDNQTYNEEKAQVELNNQIEYNLLYDQWQRNLITTDEFKTRVELLNQEYDTAMDAVEYRRLTEPWWGNLYSNLTIINTFEFDFSNVFIDIKVDYYNETSEIVSKYIGDIPAEFDGLFLLVLYTDYAIKAYSVVDITGTAQNPE